jgi:hypothetical protein
MSILSDLMGSILGGRPSMPPTDQSPAAPSQATDSPAHDASTAGPAKVDVEAVLNDKASKKGEKLNWQKSIVDLMKLVDLDSSLAARKKLAQELGYQGALDDSAEMNIWLHTQVMAKLAETGGRVPQALMH